MLCPVVSHGLQGTKLRGSRTLCMAFWHWTTMAKFVPFLSQHHILFRFCTPRSWSFVCFLSNLSLVRTECGSCRRTRLDAKKKCLSSLSLGSLILKIKFSVSFAVLLFLVCVFLWVVASSFSNFWVCLEVCHLFSSSPAFYEWLAPRPQILQSLFFLLGLKHLLLSFSSFFRLVLFLVFICESLFEVLEPVVCSLCSKFSSLLRAFCFVRCSWFWNC